MREEAWVRAPDGGSGLPVWVGDKEKWLQEGWKRRER